MGPDAPGPFTMFLLSEQAGTRTQSGEPQGVPVGFAMDQELGLEVTLAVVRPIALQGVITVGIWQALFIHQALQHRGQQSIALAEGIAWCCLESESGCVRRSRGAV